MDHKRALRVIVVSPRDVQPERDAMQSVVEGVNQTCRDLDLGFIFELWRWETDAFPGLHLQGGQGLIDEQLRIDQGDMVIGIFRKRFGTPVRDAGSGTAHEIHIAIKAWKEKSTPQVMLYFAEEATGEDHGDDDQWRRLQEF